MTSNRQQPATVPSLERRSFERISAPEAREVFDAFVRRHPARIDSFLTVAGRRAGPVDALDFSLASLQALWSWFVPAHRPTWFSSDPYRMPVTPIATEDLRPGDPVPWWAAFHWPWYLEMGPHLADLVDGFSAYVFECMIRARHGSEWRIGKGRSSANFQAPVLQLAGRGECEYSVPIIAVLHGLRGLHGKQVPGALR